MWKGLSWKLTVPLVILAGLIIVVYISTSLITDLQKDDALVVNLAGRQRMLTQKMSKEILLYSKTEDLISALNECEEKCKEVMGKSS